MSPADEESEPMTMSLQVTNEAGDESLQKAIRAGIGNADPIRVGRRDWRPVGWALRAPDGDLVGGLYGATMWGWLMIDGLWVAKELRGQGFGRRLMVAAEADAIEHGCRGAQLGTFDFQAREFYERLGYVVCGEIPDFPPGHTHYHLKKTLASPQSPATTG